ncbi:MAG: glycosyltransferase family 4 protein [Candidatus Nealsonbacteria bacterium]
MKLLVFTQKVDKEDDILGFFHNWLEKLARNFDLLNVICLQLGTYSLPQNVKVSSLGKETGQLKVKSFFIFYKYIFRLRKEYEVVFVHMNPIYVVLGGIFWKVGKKKICLWHNHKKGNFITKLAIKMSDVVFYTSPFSFAAKYKKSKVMPVGIDTDIFKKEEGIEETQNLILYLGRISSVKNIDILIEAVSVLKKKEVSFVLNIVGEPGEKDKEYFEKIKELSRGSKKINFLGKVPNYQTPGIYNKAKVFVNLTQTGSFDKTTLEAMACERMVVVSNPVFDNIFSEEQKTFFMCKEKDSQDLTDKLSKILNMSLEQQIFFGKELRKIVVKHHNLDKLVGEIIKWMKFY